MKGEKEQIGSSQSGALGEFIVLSPSQKREQERLQKEKAKKDAAERERKRKAEAKRSAEEMAAQAAAQRQASMKIIKTIIGVLLLPAAIYGLWKGAVYGFVDGGGAGIGLLIMVASFACGVIGLGLISSNT